MDTIDAFSTYFSITQLREFYCYGVRNNIDKLEYITQLILFGREDEQFNNSPNFYEKLKVLDEIIKACSKKKYYKELFFGNEKLISIFTANKLYNQAYKHAQDHLELSLSLNDSMNISKSYMMMGRIFREMRQWAQSDSVLHKALDYQTSEYNAAYTYTYIHLANLYRLQKKYEQSIVYAEKGIELSTSDVHFSEQFQSHFLKELILNYIEIGGETKVDSLLDRLDNLAYWPDQILDKYFLKGMALMKRGAYEESFDQLNRAISLADSTNAPGKIIDIFQYLFPVITEKEQLNPQYTYLLNLAVRAQKELTEQNNLDILYKELYFDLEGKKQELISSSSQLKKSKTELTNSRKLLFVSIISIIIFLFLIAFIYKNYKKNKTIATQELRFRKLRDNLFANLSHEFRTPLTVLKTSISQIGASTSSETRKNYTPLLHRNIENLVTLTNQMLDLAKMSEDKLKLQLEKADPVEHIFETLSLLSSLCEYKNIELSFTAPIVPVFINFDKNILQKVIQNLVYNAIKFTHENGKINVSVELLSTQMTVSVTDNGKGIMKEELPYIFDRYFRSYTESHDGNTGGLGLALTKQLIELMGGTIHAESTYLKGATFKFNIPIPERITIPQGKSTINIIVGTKEQFIDPLKSNVNKDRWAYRAEANNGVERKQILIVEDQLDLNRLISTELKEQYNILQAYNGEQALQLIEDKSPDLILSDIMMPTMNGIELISILSSNQNYNHIPIMVISALESDLDNLNLWKKGIVDFINKPFDLDILLLKIGNFFKSQEAIYNQYSSNPLIKSIYTSISSRDKMFVQKLIEMIEDKMHDEEFNIESLSSQLYMSRSSLYKKVKDISGFTPTQFVRKHRLHKAKTLIENDAGNISEIAHMVGYTNLSQFSRVFKEEFGWSPSKYQQKKVS